MNLNSIHDWYKSQGIDPWDFSCKHKEPCQINVADFTTITPPLIGKRYAKNDIPRLLIISSDSGRGDELPEKQELVLSGADDYAESYLSNKHWSETLHIVKAIQSRFDPTIDLKEANSCFTHIRAVKCCVNNPDSSEAPKRLFNNCFSYIGGEVEIFQPQIIITQGVRAWDALKKAKFSEIVTKKSCKKTGHDCRFSVINVTHKPVLLFFTYHPTSYHQYYPKHKDGYFSCYPEIAETFIENPNQYNKISEATYGDRE